MGVQHHFHHHSPTTKYKVQGTVDFLRDRGLLGQGRLFTKEQIFEHFNVSHSAGYRILGTPRDLEPRTFHSDHPDPRGRKKKLDHQALVQIERCIDQGVFDGRTLPWEAIPRAASLDVEVSGRTVQRAIRELNFRRCVACENEYRSSRSKAARVEHARAMLERYPQPNDWYRVRFSGECHFAWGPEGRVSVLRRPWERFCPDCMVETEAPAEKDIRRLHCWAAAGHDFKSDLVWYDMPDSNGKLTMTAYRDQILEPVVGSWLRAGHHFVLEEDCDSGHSGKKGNNIVTKWKQENGLESYFNCPLSPDFVPIERALQSPKQYVTKRPCWDDRTVKELVEEGWAALKQESINRWVDQIPRILKDCIKMEGA
ncbi:hypothetical protein C8A03DRAFT_15612 [Achaetomium macrosporum]|uniref:Hmg box protein n=1 Tax=Achaetomium macrosporum TaxID=79813 RepID=A0AAN7C9H6_9PEZI|nr:hypothetical protein C8A03DRAFT_15612 [Achaetomium macrosporum]